jgi:hypothetical protein
VETNKKYTDTRKLGTAGPNSKEWFVHCQKTSLPYIIVKGNQRIASITWDSIAWPKEYDVSLDARTTELRESFASLFEKYAAGNRRAKLVDSNRAATFSGIDGRAAGVLAEELYDLLLPIAKEAKDLHRPETLP